MRRVNIISAVLLLALSGFVILESRQFPQGSGTLGPAFFPDLVAGLIIAFSIALLVFAFKNPEQGEFVPPQRRTLWTMLCLVAYVILLPILGFVVTTPAFLLITGLVLADDVRRWWKPALVSAVLTTVGLYLLFAELLNVRLP